MTLKAKLIYLFCCVLAVFSCSDDDGDPTPANPLGVCKLTESETDDGGKQLVEWNGDQVTKITYLRDEREVGYVLVSYTDGKISKVEEYGLDGQKEEPTYKLEETRTYEYNDKGQWIKINKTDEWSTIVATATYDGDLRSRIEFSSESEWGSDKEVEEFTYSNGNLSKRVSTFTSFNQEGEQVYSSTNTSTYEYSDKEDKAIAITEIFNTIWGGGQTPNKNYEVKRTTVSGTTTSVNISEYVFDDRGYPTKVTGTYTYTNGDQEVEETYYTWDCK